MKKSILLLSFISALVLLSGCSRPFMWNQTQRTVPSDPSGIYTLTMATHLNQKSTVVPESIRAQVIVEGRTFPMRRRIGSPYVFTYNYSMPAGARRAVYYFILDYDQVMNGRTRRRQIVSELYSLELLDQGFEPPVVFVPEEEVEQTIPAFSVEVLPSEAITLTVDQETVLLFSIDSTAPEGGVVIPVTTDIPESVIMPEVIIPEGDQTVQVTIKGGIPDSGNLFISPTGAEEIILPITIEPALK